MTDNDWLLKVLGKLENDPSLSEVGVQTRALILLGPRGWAVHASVYVGKKIVGLKAKDIDVLVAFIVPKNLWYVVPVRAFAPRKNLWFYPDGSKKGSMFEKFREAWEVMEGEE